MGNAKAGLTAPATSRAAAPAAYAMTGLTSADVPVSPAECNITSRRPNAPTIASLKMSRPRPIHAATKPTATPGRDVPREIYLVRKLRLSEGPNQEMKMHPRHRTRTMRPTRWRGYKKGTGNKEWGRHARSRPPTTCNPQSRRSLRAPRPGSKLKRHNESERQKIGVGLRRPGFTGIKYAHVFQP